jgi:predicted RNase H-like HicB family nuclease
MQLTAILIPEPEGGYTISNLETGTTSQGETIDEALANLQEATELYLEEFPTDMCRMLTSSLGASVASLEGWQQASREFPPFETRPYGPLLRARWCGAAAR